MWSDFLARAHGLRCAEGDQTACGGGCERRAGEYLGDRYPTCPVREVIDDARLQYVLGLERASRLSPVADWPEGFAAWVPDLWSELVAARESRREHSGGRR